MDERDNINKYREKTKRNKSTVRFVVFILITAVVAIAVINWKSILRPLKDIGSKAGEGGFPIALTGSANYVLGDIGENFYLLTDTYLHTYNSNGAELLNKQHGLQRPISTSNDKRILLYDKNGKDIKLYSRNSEQFTMSFDDTIVFAKMGTDDRSAVITTSMRYSNYLYVLNSEGKQIFRWSSPDEKIMQVCFDKGDKSIFVSVVGEKNGTLRSCVLRFELSGGEGETWRTSIGSSVSYSLEKTSGGVYAVTSEGAFLINSDTGEVKASNTFSKEIYGIPKTNGIRTMIFKDPVSNGKTVSVYNDALEPVAALSIDSISAFDTSGGRLYVLSQNTLTSYDTSLQQVNIYEFDDEYYDIKIIDGEYAVLLGYNSIWRVKL